MTVPRLSELLLPPDTRARNRIIAALAGDPATVLDVGGIPRLLGRFLPRARVTTANVEPPADVVVAGTELPFADDSFDVVTSIDVLEHLAAPDRPAHLAELTRVAAKRVVLCCPLGSPEHTASEEQLTRWYSATVGCPHRFLEEHRRHGLPTEEELRALAAATDWPAELRFHGDFRRAERVFRLGVAARRRPTPASLGRYAWALLAGREGGLEPASFPWANRVFIVLERRVTRVPA